MNEMICKQCGSLLESRDLICPCCKTPRLSSKHVQYSTSKSRQYVQENLCDAGSVGFNQGYAKTRNTFGFFVIGFILGCFMPVILAIIIMIVCSKKMLSANKNMNEQYKLVVCRLRNGLLCGVVVFQIVIPIIVTVLGLLIGYL